MAVLNPKLGDYIHDALDKIEHTSTVAVYYHSFAAIQGLLLKVQPWLPEPYLSTRFVYGLRPEYQLFVLQFRPVTVSAAFRLATIYEESVGASELGKQVVLGFESPDLDSNSPVIIELGNLLHDNMDQIPHTTSVEAFYHQFETVKCFLAAAKPWLPESYFASRFVYGFQEEYLNFILRFNPVTVTAAYRLACIYEDSIYLEYFPESLSQKVDILGIMAEEKQLVDPSLDQASEEVLGEILTSISTSSTHDIRSVQVEEGVVDTLNGCVAIASPRHDALDSVVLATSQRSDTGSPNVSLGQGTNIITTQVSRCVNEMEVAAYGLVLDAQSSYRVDQHVSNSLAFWYSAAIYSTCTLADHALVSTTLLQMDGSPLVPVSLTCIRESKRSTLNEVQGNFSGFILEPCGLTICYVPVQTFGAVVPVAGKDIYDKYTRSIMSRKTVGDVQSTKQAAWSMLIVKCFLIKLIGMEAMMVLYVVMFCRDTFVIMLAHLWYALRLTVWMEHIVKCRFIVTCDCIFVLLATSMNVIPMPVYKFFTSFSRFTIKQTVGHVSYVTSLVSINNFPGLKFEIRVQESGLATGQNDNHSYIVACIGREVFGLV